MDEIQKAACEHFRLKQADLLGERRTRAVARPRQVAMYLAKTLTSPVLSRHRPPVRATATTPPCLHAVRQIEKLKAEDPALAADVETLTRKLRD